MVEPSTGLDPQARLFVWDRIRDLRAAGVTTVITTHDMDEAAELSDRVGIMDHGKLLALDTPAALTKSLPGSATLDLTVHFAETDAADDVLKALSEVDNVEKAEQVAMGGPAGGTGGFPGGFGAFGGFSGGAPDGPPGAGGPPLVETQDLRVRLYLTTDPAALLGPVSQLLAGRNARLTAVNLGEPSLEDVFIHLTGRDLR